MIARTFPCDRERFADLLADRLPPDESEEIAAHIEQCVSCRQHLETLAGAGEDWTAARDALSASDLAPLHPPAGSPDAIREIFSDVSWVRSLLQPGEADDLGRLGRYPVRGVVGQGGMGVVLRAWDDELNRPLAIKLLAPHLASSGAARKRFLREAQAAAAVVHPSVVPIYSVTSEARVPYLVMPYIGGGNLQQRIDRDGPLEVDELLRIGLQIAEGLAAAHRQGLVHRDIKPANILLEEGGHRVLISDFGLARALDDASLTQSGLIAGTPPYMSPEQARGDAADYRSDLFSLGSVLYAMATGRPPFRGESSLAVLRQIGERRVTPVREINERMPAWLDRLIGRLMQKDAAERPATAEQVVELLRHCLSHVRTPTVEPLPREVAATRRIGRWPLAVIIVVLGTLAGIFMRNQGIPDAPFSGDGGAAIAEQPAIAVPNKTKAPERPTPSVADDVPSSNATRSPRFNPDPVDREIDTLRIKIEQLRSELLENREAVEFDSLGRKSEVGV